jgi:NhaP-type Na+/H+ or K+/H+ antiporter
MTVLSILVPILAGILVIALLGWAFRRLRVWRERRARGGTVET